MGKSFIEINKKWLQYLQTNHLSLQKKNVVGKVRELLKSYDGDKMLTPPAPLFFDEDDYVVLSHACKTLINAQSKILNHLLSTYGKDGLLKFFSIKEEMHQFIDWQELIDAQKIVSRFDVIPTNDRFYICEINTDPSVGGGDVFDCAEVFFDAAGIEPPYENFSPNYDKALLVKKLCLQKQLQKIVILGWHSYENDGYTSFELEKKYFESLLPEYDVEIYHEYNFPIEYLDDTTSRELLIYRIGVFDDMTEEAVELFKRIIDSHATVINTFENEIRMSKSWLSIFHSEPYQEALNSEEIAIIKQFIPYTFALSIDSLDDALNNKDSYIFKFNHSYGGYGILMGSEHDKDILRKKLIEQGVELWTVQEVVRFDGMGMPYNEKFESDIHNYVFGLYVVDGQCKGFNVRASRRSKVVNLSTDPETLCFCALPIKSNFFDSLI